MLRVVAAMADFVKDPNDWLRRLSPDEWIRAALAELRKAEEAYGRGNARAGAAGVKRAAGMALNGALLVEPDEAWGRSYVDHVQALAADASVPAAVRSACQAVLEARGPEGGAAGVIQLRTPRTNEAVLEAARDVVAHAYAVVKRHEAKGG
jgi:HEPN domain-containing protein